MSISCLRTLHSIHLYNWESTLINKWLALSVSNHLHTFSSTANIPPSSNLEALYASTKVTYPYLSLCLATMQKISDLLTQECSDEDMEGIVSPQLDHWHALLGERHYTLLNKDLFSTLSAAMQNKDLSKEHVSTAFYINHLVLFFLREELLGILSSFREACIDHYNHNPGSAPMLLQRIHVIENLVIRYSTRLLGIPSLDFTAVKNYLSCPKA